MHLPRLGSLPVHYDLTSGLVKPHFRFSLTSLPVRVTNECSSENLKRVLKNGIVEFLLYLEQKVKTVNATLLNIFKSKWNAVA